MASAMAAPVSPSQSSGSSNSKDELAAMLEAELESAWAEEDADESSGKDETRDRATEEEELAGSQERDASRQAPDGEDRNPSRIEDKSASGQPEKTMDASSPATSAGTAGPTGGTGQPRGQTQDAAPGTSSGTKRSREGGEKNPEAEAQASMSSAGAIKRDTSRDSASRSKDSNPSIKDSDLGSRDGSGGGMCPPHPGFMMGMCVACGMLKEATGADSRPEPSQAEAHRRGPAPTAHAQGRMSGKPQPGPSAAPGTVQLKYIHQSLELSTEGAAALRQREQAQLVRRRRLCLVLDLDHTLLNSAKHSDISQAHMTYLCNAYRVQGVLTPPHQHTPQPHPRPSTDPAVNTLFHLPFLHMWTKLRPGVHQFLERMHQRYELYVYTNGERMYADAMARLLDPSGRMFGGRVIACSDSTVWGTKDLDVLLGADAMAVILDDSVGVWPRHKSNLVIVERYHFFPTSRGEFNLAGPGLVEQRRDEVAPEDQGGLLLSMAALLERLWAGFYAKMDAGSEKAADVRQELGVQRWSILAGCHLVFSRVFPTDCASPKGHLLWQKAKSMGAACHSQVGPTVTHVVALDRGTDKAMWALSQGRHLVTPAWIEYASTLWCKGKEDEFPVPGGKGLVGFTPSQHVVPTLPMPEREVPAVTAEEKEGQEKGEMQEPGPALIPGSPSTQQMSTDTADV